MIYTGLTSFIHELDKQGELIRVKTFVDPVLEIAEVTDRISKRGGKALLFENTGTQFPVLTNAYGSALRLKLALGNKNPEDHAQRIVSIFSFDGLNSGSILKKLSALPSLARLAGYLPIRTKQRGMCQQVIHTNPDIGILPVLKCWPHDGGRFITLPVVHTCHPETGSVNAGMYRMQILDKNSTAMHWQRHKTGAVHFEAWRNTGRKMPVAVSLGGDPVYTYSATAPLPENISEYILAGFLRERKVKLVKCITCDIYVPYDADIVLEGYIDPSEQPVWEGPFGDHTGFYSLADWYPRFHVTCITHSRSAVYPATIVGIPPQEDSWLTQATEKIFFPPVKIALQPEIEDFHIPDPGVAHNLVIVKISKRFPGQGMKVVNSLFGAGQMMFTKYIVVVSGDVNIRNYRDLCRTVFENTGFDTDVVFSRGPLDVLDHASDSQAFGGKAGIDATVKLPEERAGRNDTTTEPFSARPAGEYSSACLVGDIIKDTDCRLMEEDIPVLILSADLSGGDTAIEWISGTLKKNRISGMFRMVLVVDKVVDPHDYFRVAWQVLGNSDPLRDHRMIDSGCMLIDGTIKCCRNGRPFPRKWPNTVCSSKETTLKVDRKWESLGLGEFIPSPSDENRMLCRGDKEEITCE